MAYHQGFGSNSKVGVLIGSRVRSSGVGLRA